MRFFRFVVIDWLVCMARVLLDRVSPPPPQVVPSATQDEINDAVTHGGSVYTDHTGAVRVKHLSRTRARLTFLVVSIALMLGMSNPFVTDGKVRTYVRRTAAKIAALTSTALGSGELMVDEHGHVYGGDGTTFISALKRLLRIDEIGGIDLRSSDGVDPLGASGDQSTALQAAADAAVAAGVSLIIRQGTYVGTFTWAPGNNKDIRIIGKAGSVLKAPADGTPVITINGGTSNNQRQDLGRLTVDLDSKDTPAVLLLSFGQIGILHGLRVYNVKATATRYAVELGDGSTSPNDIAFAIMENCHIKGSATTGGGGVLSRSPLDSVTFRHCRFVNIGTPFANDPATSHGGSTVSFDRCVFEQCTIGASLTSWNAAAVSFDRCRFEAFSQYGIDANGLDSNYVLGSMQVWRCYFSGMTASAVGIRISEVAAFDLQGCDFIAVNGQSLGSYPLSTPVAIGAHVTRYRQRGNRNGVAIASGGTIVTSSVGPMTMPTNFLPSTDITRDMVSADVPLQGSAKTTVFTTPGAFTLTYDPWAKGYRVVVVGGGGAGGSGRRGAAGTNRCGGGGGAGGQVTRMDIPGSAITGDVTGTVGAGGTGGAAVTTDDTDGNPGTAGTATTFGAFAKAGGGGLGSGGTNATGTGGSGPTGSGQFGGGGGASASTVGAAGNASASVAAGAAGGGAGGGINTSNTQSAGGLGGVVGAHASAGPGAAGTAGGGNGGNGTDSSTGSGIPGPSAGGGGSNLTGAGGAGGNGGKYGAGGAGGGASVNGNNSGKGGDGAPGTCVVTTYY